MIAAAINNTLNMFTASINFTCQYLCCSFNKLDLAAGQVYLRLKWETRNHNFVAGR
jgi:hypothetical protein